ncbi:MAG TPA: L-serine ammonia-lyase [Candidatus Dormibacteraeota bacterium]|nr:L-serine ammonia-lyase [Candidatus Dormibacteraeota bacterium]
MYISLFDIFKVGLGPSSSHTVGPMRAAALFAESLRASGELARTQRIHVDLYGSLALTGRGHATDRALLLGLEGHRPDEIDPEFAQRRVDEIRAQQRLLVDGERAISFDDARDITWRMDELLERHSNGMRFTALDANEAVLLERTYFSIGGGFVECAEESTAASERAAQSVPFPFSSAAELLAIARERGAAIWEIVYANECALRPPDEVDRYIDRILAVMHASVERGLRTDGILPGGLNVRRRAKRIHERLLAKRERGALDAVDEVDAAAMAVNEENAAGGRVVTAPTNGAAGVIPAVLEYYDRHIEGSSREGKARFLLTASAIGALYKTNASISGAEVGCQGEVGVACSMAAGGLVAASNGSNDEAEHAAEIGMEHSLGMTCDPIGGLVQIPCIERNAVGAVRAIHAARMAMAEEGDHRVSLDSVIDVMYRTGIDMQSKYKETSLGGLAVGIIQC